MTAGMVVQDKAPGVVRDVVSLTKPRVTQLVVFTMGAGLYVAPGSVGWLRAVLAMLGCVLLVGSANTLNCWLERDTDAFMTRTRGRPLPGRRIPDWYALALGGLLLVNSLPLLYFAANPVTAELGLVAHVVYVALYTPLKRRSAWSTVVGFIPGAMPPLMGWTTITGQLDLAGVMLFMLMFTWQLPHTLAIGMFRGQEYAAAGIKVIPNALGEREAARQIFFTTLLLLPVTLSLPLLGVSGWLYLSVAAVLGTVFLAIAARGLKANPGMPWARRVFFFSIAYLSVLLAVLTLDKAALG